MEKPPFKPQLHLAFQGSIPANSVADGEAEYENLKIFLLAIDPNVTLNGQVVKMLERCCKKPQPKQKDQPGIKNYSPNNPTGAKTQ